MSETGYIYSISADFPNGINNANLTNEISNSLVITKTLTYITIVGSANQVRIFFSTPISSPTETDELDTIVSNHDPIPMDDEPETLNNIQPTSATGTVQISDFTFGNNIFQPFDGGPGAIENCIIDIDNNTVTNIDNANIKSGAAIDSSKIANGTVSNAEFQNINGLTSSAVGTTQTQTLTNKTINSSNNTLQNITNTNISASAAINPSKINLTKFDAYNTASQTLSIIPTWTAVNLDVQRQIDSDFSHTTGTSNITINTTGTYLIIARCTNQGGNSRSESQCRLTLDPLGGGTFSEIAGTIGAMYHRNSASNQNTASINLILSLTATDQIRLETGETNGGVLSTLINGCSVTILRIA